MKLKTFLMAAGVAAILASCSSNRYQATDQTTLVTVPTHMQTTFATEYPGATNVIWTNYNGDEVLISSMDWDLYGWPTMDASDYVVRFDMDGEKHYAWYDSDGTWIGTAVVVNDYKTVPTAVTNYLNSYYPGYTISSVNKEWQKDRVAYEVELKNSSTKVKLLIDGNGNVIKQKSKPI
jgi:hypothetical protein